MLDQATARHVPSPVFSADSESVFRFARTCSDRKIFSPPGGEMFINFSRNKRQLAELQKYVRGLERPSSRPVFSADSESVFRFARTCSDRKIFSPPGGEMFINFSRNKRQLAELQKYVRGLERPSSRPVFSADSESVFRFARTCSDRKIFSPPGGEMFINFSRNKRQLAELQKYVPPGG